MIIKHKTFIKVKNHNVWNGHTVIFNILWLNFFYLAKTKFGFNEKTQNWPLLYYKLFKYNENNKNAGTIFLFIEIFLPCSGSLIKFSIVSFVDLWWIPFTVRKVVKINSSIYDQQLCLFSTDFVFFWTYPSIIILLSLSFYFSFYLYVFYCIMSFSVGLSENAVYFISKLKQFILK